MTHAFGLTYTNSDDGVHLVCGRCKWDHNLGFWLEGDDEATLFAALIEAARHQCPELLAEWLEHPENMPSPTSGDIGHDAPPATGGD